MRNYIYLLALSLAACSPEAEVDSGAKAPIVKRNIEEILEEEVVPENIVPDGPIFATEGLDFGFSGFIVSIDSMDIVDYKGDLILPKNDTCSYFLDLGEDIIHVPLRVSPTKTNEFMRFEVFQRAIYHFSISNEGPHCDLIKEEPYYGKWTKLGENNPNYSFYTLRWGQMKTPEVAMSDEEFRSLVLKNCSEKYADLLGNAYISASSQDHLVISGYELKIIATKSDGSVNSSFICFSVPMGC